MRRGVALVLLLGLSPVFADAAQTPLAASLRITVMITGNGKDQRAIVLIGFVELTLVKCALPIEIDHVAQVIQEARLFRLIRFL